MTAMIPGLFLRRSTDWLSHSTLYYILGATESLTSSLSPRTQKPKKVWQHIFQSLPKAFESHSGHLIPTGAVQHPLDDLLIYRAILVALLYSLVADSSDLLENESYKVIIPIL
jgi:hypothetical protein